MRYERRQNSGGSHYYRFTYYDHKLKKVTHMTKQEIRRRFGRDIVDEDDAKECVKLLSAKFETEKIRIKRRLDWQEKFYSFAKLADLYEEKQKKRAPNSWQNNCFYLRHYVLYYFLQKEKINLIDLWVDHFEKFRTWLESAPQLRSKAVIAYASKNHAIKSLNTFLDHLEAERVINFSQRCPTFPEYLLNSRTVDDVVMPEEMEQVYSELLSGGRRTDAIFYRFLFFSGMRFNEARAVSVADLFQGVIASEFLENKLRAYGIEYYGYIVLEGQFDRVDQVGRVTRVPFKGRRKIEEKHNRVLPIIDKVLWNGLVDLAGEVHETMSRHQSAKDCLLFRTVDDTTSAGHLKKAYASRKLKWRPWHCLRHSRATFLIGQTSDTMLARIWLGHSSPRTIEKYNHLYQAITRAAKVNATVGEKLNLKKVD